jgi:hypothetical protein
VRRLALLAALASAVPAAALEYRSPWGLLSADGYLEGLAAFRIDRNTPGQRPEALWVSRLTADPHRRLRFYLETRMQAGGPPTHGDGFGVFNLSDTFQNRSPSLEVTQGWVDLSLPNADLRVGMQKFAWGRLDRFQPTDVLNPRRYTDPIRMDEPEAKLGVPALQGSLYPPEGRWVPPDTALTLVWIPVPLPVRFPLPQERWFPPSIRTLTPIDIPKDSITPGVPPTPIAVAQRFTVRNRTPPQQLDEGSVGVRLSSLAQGVDWALSYYDGAETTPNFTLDALTSCMGRTARSPCPNVTRLQTVEILRPTFTRIRQVGADAAFQLGGVATRVELAYGADRRFPRATSELLTRASLLRAFGGPQGAARAIGKLARGETVVTRLPDLVVSRDAVQWGVGVDYLWHGWMPLLQLNQEFILDNDLRLLVNDVDTRLTFVLRKAFLADTLSTELTVVQGLERSATVGIARATYAVTDDLRLRLGYLMIAGSRSTLIGQYHDNDEGFVELRYSY